MREEGVTLPRLEPPPKDDGDGLASCWNWGSAFVGACLAVEVCEKAELLRDSIGSPTNTNYLISCSDPLRRRGSGCFTIYFFTYKQNGPE